MAMLDFVNVFVSLIDALKRAHEANEKKKADEAKALSKTQAVKAPAGP
jgi:hypothetical protein